MEEVNPALALVRDFVNTLEVETGEDRIAAWLAGAAPRELAEARRVREALRALLRANNGCGGETGAALAVLDAASRRARVGLRFGSGGIRFAGRGGLGGVLAAVGEAMADGSWERLKACRADDCRWAFVDSARNRSRQWCSMEVCGNREKARAYRRRHGAAGA